MNDDEALAWFEGGLLIGLMIGEASFGGDGRQAQVTIKMNVRHKALLQWLESSVPGSKLYGPYLHDSRNYYQWMVRGEHLKKKLIPLLDRLSWRDYDPYSYERYEAMKKTYKL